jgi:hypothetical protein
MSAETYGVLRVKRPLVLIYFNQTWYALQFFIKPSNLITKTIKFNENDEYKKK